MLDLYTTAVAASSHAGPTSQLFNVKINATLKTCWEVNIGPGDEAATAVVLTIIAIINIYCRLP